MTTYYLCDLSMSEMGHHFLLCDTVYAFTGLMKLLLDTSLFSCAGLDLCLVQLLCDLLVTGTDLSPLQPRACHSGV